ncbi:hypothetical protein ADICEAN_03205 [Cesiribacter andamanensis AMV16]|uniref:Uncharacterized protein n=1 Tax=Cesiribacter andamanensis AMV16 TaxID=1279009 RepID=M7MYX4_9BACT|nr:hypothetical protein ADICEAN_03205 [Cesiribacter andamanensis AMV16]
MYPYIAFLSPLFTQRAFFIPNFYNERLANAHF